jgi:hypothetical protein
MIPSKKSCFEELGSQDLESKEVKNGTEFT